ncbi:hypothetical protein QFZ91_001288 [Paraburkholderia sp. JPY419]
MCGSAHCSVAVPAPPVMIASPAVRRLTSAAKVIHPTGRLSAQRKPPTLRPLKVGNEPFSGSKEVGGFGGALSVFV